MIRSLKILLFIYVTISFNIFAQKYEHTHRVTTLRMIIHEEGTERELNYILNEWIEKIGKRNNKILSYTIHKNINNQKEIKFIITDELYNQDLFSIEKKINYENEKNIYSFPFHINKS